MRWVACLLLAVALSPAADTEVGSRACAGCHAAIFESYSRTAMARSSGRVGTGAFREAFTMAAFEDAASGASYRIAAGEGAHRMQFEQAAREVAGHRDLAWFVGSGSVGRSYLFSVDGFLFQAPVAYYSAARRWNLSPGFGGKPAIEMARPVETACLQCHASRPQAVEGTRNHYRDPPFLEGGISCERCHGAGSEHVALMKQPRRAQGSLRIVNPARLDPARRDSVCEQCHLTGAARVAKPVSRYMPGDALSDHLAVFLWSSRDPGAQRAATDHAEQLSRSGCRQAAGTRLWCGSCHDPHSQPGAGERAALFRSRCLSCHGDRGKACSLPEERRAAASDDCAYCHMPKGESREGEHVVYTNHEIPRGAPSPSGPSAVPVLLSYWPGKASPRDEAMAYAVLAMQRPDLRRRALQMLETAASRTEDDIPLFAQLAQFHDAIRRTSDARSLYERVLRLDPDHATAAANLAVHWIEAGRTAEAIELWERVVSRNPSMTGAAMNLAVAYLRSGQKEQGLETLRRLLRFQPDHEAARDLLRQAAP